MLDTGPEKGLDRLTRLAAALVGTPVSFVSLVEEERQFFISHTGLAEPWASARQTPISHSFCRFVVASNEPLVVSDAREHPELHDNPAIDDLGVVAYLGVPLRNTEGHVLGSFCVVDSIPRDWSQTQIETLHELAAAAASEIELRARLARSDEIDPVTGMLTQARLQRETESALETVSRSRRVALLLVQLTRLSLVQESLGRAAADQLIAAVAARLHEQLRSVTLGRAGADQLAVLCPAVSDEREALAVAQRTRKLLREPFLIHDVSLYAEVAIGIAIADPSDAAEGLFDGALSAARHARESPGNVRLIGEEPIRHEARQRLRLENDVRGALERGELQAHYQPRVRLSDGTIVGFEALARWAHRDRGWVSPSEFIPVAEESGLIGPLGEAILRLAIREAAGWPALATRSRPYVSVNLSPVQTAVARVAPLVVRILDEFRFPAQLLRLEVTEATLLDHVHHTRLRELVELGVQLDLDDFGTGYSSLSYLARFPLSGLKIDRSFITGLDDRRGETLIRTIIAMADALGLEITAEGIETEHQRQALTDMGCQYAQGYLFGRPRPGRDVQDLLQARAAAPR